MKKKTETPSAYWRQVAQLLTKTGAFGSINLFEPLRFEKEKRPDQHKKMDDLQTVGEGPIKEYRERP